MPETDLSYMNAEYVISRFRELQSDFTGRNDRMNLYEELYNLDVWEGEAEEEEVRVTSPRANFIVERYRALLLTEPPIINVPEGNRTKVGQRLAGEIEKYLYGAWNEMQMLDVLAEAEWHANCLGVGVIRVQYHERTPEGEFPLSAQPLDPRNCYWDESVRRQNTPTKFVHALRRSRQRVIEEWGEVFDDEPIEEDQRAQWLTELVDYYDYWETDVVEKPARPKGVEEEGVNVMRTLLKRAMERISPEEESFEEEEEGVRYVREVRNCVVADGNVVKEATVMEGYEEIPFVWWSGIKTGIQERKNRYHSVLFALTGGDSGETGIIGLENQMLALKALMAMKYANAALVTNDPDLQSLDARPGAINVTRQDRQDILLEWVQPPGTHPDVDEVLAYSTQLAEMSTLPKAMHGQYVGEISGVALSLLVNPVLTQIANRQRERERAWARVNKMVLFLTESYAPDEGWPVYGTDETGVGFETSLAPLAIMGYRRNEIKLSASLPKDRHAMAQMMMLLSKEMLLSKRQAIEQVQQIFAMHGYTPDDEMEAILTESLLYGNEEIRHALSMEALAAYDPELAQMLMQEQQQQQPQQPGPPGQGPGGVGQREPMGGPMMGQPPENVPPEFMGGGGTQPRPRGGQPNVQNL